MLCSCVRFLILIISGRLGYCVCVVCIVVVSELVVWMWFFLSIIVLNSFR